MKVRYDKLWRLMKDNKMKKSDLSKAAEISSYAMTKLNNDRPVSMEVMIIIPWQGWRSYSSSTRS